MERHSENLDGGGPNAAQQRDAGQQAGHAHADQRSGDDAAHSARNTPADLSGATSQAERAVMHPENHDAEWRYYHTAWHS